MRATIIIIIIAVVITSHNSHGQDRDKGHATGAIRASRGPCCKLMVRVRNHKLYAPNIQR